MKFRPVHLRTGLSHSITFAPSCRGARAVPGSGSFSQHKQAEASPTIAGSHPLPPASGRAPTALSPGPPPDGGSASAAGGDAPGGAACRLRFAVLAILLAVLPGCGQRDASRGVELVMSSTDPVPDMTFELRFASAMVDSSRVGLPDATPPLVITPAVPGTFTWTSPRGGSFVPAQALALDSEYALSLRPELRRADGQRDLSVLRRRIRTPAFGVTAGWPGEHSANAGAQPVITLAFNADVNAREAGRRLYFRDAAGRRLPALARQATELEASVSVGYAEDTLTRTWADRFSRNGPAGPGVDRLGLGTNPVSNMLIVTPQRPLPTGKDWCLVASAGIPASDGLRRSRRRVEIPVGNITPFSVFGVTAEHSIHSGPSIRIQFSKPLAAELANGIGPWIDVRPAVTNLTSQVEDRAVTLRGAFRGETAYAIRLHPEIPAAERFPLRGSNLFRVWMPGMAPRLYFPAFSGDQLASGQRSFPLLAVNVPRMRLRARVLPPDAAIHALRGYGSYFASWQQLRQSRDWAECYRAIDYNQVPGREVFNRTIDLNVEPDMPRTVDFRWDDILGQRRTGVVFLDARQAESAADEDALLPGTQAVIQLTDLGLLWKQGVSGVDLFVFSLQTGRPVAGAAARLFSNDNEILRETVTSDEGLAHLEAPGAAWIGAQKGDDFHALALEQNHAPLYHFDFYDPGASSGNGRRVLLITDRNLYRPGETMRLLALVREWSEPGLTVPAGLTGLLECVDPRDRRFFETNVVFGASGGWECAVPLPELQRGSCPIRLRLGGAVYATEVHIQDFQPSAFEVTLDSKPEYAAGDPVRLLLSARYHFGQALSRAQLKWSLAARDGDFQPQGYEAFQFGCDGFPCRFGWNRSAIALHGSGTLAGSDPFLIQPEIPVRAVAPQPRRVSLLAEVTDLNQQTISSAAEFLQHSSDFYLGLRAADEVRAGTNWGLEMLVLRRDGRPWPDAVDAQLRVQKVVWESVAIQAAGGGIRYRNEPVFTNILQQVIRLRPADTPVEPGGRARGIPVDRLPALEPGEYVAEAKTADPRGRPVMSSVGFRAAAPGATGSRMDRRGWLALRPDRECYVPGQTASVRLEAPFNGTALVTVEREKVLRSFVIQSESNAPLIRVPIERADVPNVFVGVTMIRGAEISPHRAKRPEYRLGFCQLNVADPESRLEVCASASKTNCLPGQPVEITVRVSDTAGAAVPGAEVLVYAIDEGVLGLSGYTPPDPHAFFYAARPLAVETSMSIPSLLAEDREKMDFANKGFLGGGGGCERVRRQFLACAYWNAALRTDSAGAVTDCFPAPDSLTRYRVFAIARHSSTRFGHGQATFEVAKPVAVEPALPAFATVTDRLIACGVVHNQTTAGIEATVTLELDDKAKPDEPGAALIRRLAVGPKGSAMVEFPVQLKDTGRARWLWKARLTGATAGDFTDAVESTVDIGHLAPQLRQAWSMRIASSSTNLLAPADPRLLAGRGAFTVRIAASRLNELGEPAAQLLAYPYGCAEQTSSSLLPWIVLRDDAGLLPETRRGPYETRRAIRAGITRLLSMQTPSGGLGYWPGAREPMFWTSAYGGMVLALARQHEMDIPEADFTALLSFLSRQLRVRGVDAADLSDRCLAVYALALAGRAEPAYHQHLFGLRAKLSLEDRALLALAVAESRGPAAMISELLRSASGAPAAESRFGCPARADAVRLLAWMRHAPQDGMVDRLVQDLVREQRDGHWGTTQANAWALLALTEYARRMEDGSNGTAGHLYAGGQPVSFVLSGKSDVFACTIPLTNGPPPTLILSNASVNPLYANVLLEARLRETRQPPLACGFVLQRQYERLDDENLPQDPSELRVGDRVLITLRLTVREPARYVALDDALPSNLEAVHAEFKTQAARAAGPAAASGSRWPADFQEIRKDRWLSFANHVAPGEYTVRYLARVRAAGTVTAPSAKVEEMYHPERYALSGSQTLVSRLMERQPEPGTALAGR